MKYKFAIDKCPLCEKQLIQLSYGANNNTWECLEKSDLMKDGLILPHYQVEFDIKNCIVVQHIVVYPYILDTFNDEITRIFSYKNGSIQYIMSIPQIHPDSPDKMKSRIEGLVAFL